MQIRFYTFILVILLMSFLTSCIKKQTIENESNIKLPKQERTQYVIRAGDELEIKFFFNPELNEIVTVRPDGMISLQLLDEILVSGLTPSELDDRLTEEYSRELKKPVVTVFVRTFSAHRIYIGGEVNSQGMLILPTGMTLLQAIFASGGLKDTAQAAETIVIRKGSDNRPIPMQIDLAAALQGKGMGTQFLLQPSDIVYVPKSPIAKANQFVNQYIEQLFLFRGVSLGFTYELRNFND